MINFIDVQCLFWKMVLEISVDNIKIEQHCRKICQRIILTK